MFIFIWFLAIAIPSILKVLKEPFQNEQENETIPSNINVQYIFLWIVLNFVITFYAVYISLKCKKDGFIEAILAFIFPYFYVPFRFIKPC